MGTTPSERGGWGRLIAECDLFGYPTRVCEGRLMDPSPGRGRERAKNAKTSERPAEGRFLVPEDAPGPMQDGAVKRELEHWMRCLFRPFLLFFLSSLLAEIQPLSSAISASQVI